MICLERPFYLQADMTTDLRAHFVFIAYRSALLTEN